MKDKEFELLLNPVRFRIMQYLLYHKEATAQELSAFLSDIPQASLYRHINRLTTSGIIKVIKEQRVRGAVEKTYGVSETAIEQAGTNAEGYNKIRMILTALQGEFHRYMQDETNDPEKDMLAVTGFFFNASDQEMEDAFEELQKICEKLQRNPACGDRKLRKWTFISSPAQDTSKGGRHED